MNSTNLKKVKEGEDAEATKKATEELSLAAQKIGEKLYKAATDAQAAQTPPTGDPASAEATAGEAKTEPEVKDAETKEGEAK